MLRVKFVFFLYLRIQVPEVGGGLHHPPLRNRREKPRGECPLSVFPVPDLTQEKSQVTEAVQGTSVSGSPPGRTKLTLS